MSPSPLAWALYSPARFVAVLVAGAVLLVALIGLGLRDAGGSTGSTSERPRTAETPAAAAPTIDADAHHDGHGHALGPAARRTVEKFLQRYLAPTSSRELARLQPLCTTDLWAGLKVADPSRMPAGPVKKIEKLADGAFTASFRVDTRSSSLTVEVVSSPGGPRVASVEPERP